MVWRRPPLLPSGREDLVRLLVEAGEKTAHQRVLSENAKRLRDDASTGVVRIVLDT